MFDLDGTLVDTNYASYLAYKKAMKEVLLCDINYTCVRNGRFTRETFRRMFPSVTAIDEKNIVKLKNQYYSKYLSSTSLNTTLFELIMATYNSKEIILVTNSHEERAMITLQYHNLNRYFSKVLTKENYGGYNKYLYAVNYLQVDTASTVVFENEKAEIDAAIRTGIPNDNIIKITNKYF
ncbi:MAG: HAD hydrolase-like protein [Clostridiales bacterium]|nr:HAD hydrolase-like protein [Clostridiales bacterium]